MSDARKDLKGVADWWRRLDAAALELGGGTVIVGARKDRGALGDSAARRPEAQRVALEEVLS